jgi:hypothetical protein
MAFSYSKNKEHLTKGERKIEREQVILNYEPIYKSPSKLITRHSIEDKERTIEELISFFLHSLYSWTAAYLAPLVISYNDFLVLFSSSS